ncbi:DUF2218 domain-containing protein [Sphingomonas sp. CARO-RG-8B-R24-01]|uniref:DUF2218 domain-containing protein n=1 Tax=Sphingomonas sp. CARO-RG-8B-R24-01 TaxID=2914831 RepID=UPI001F5AE2DC|nr:DUF2218 domain-containing protein [Sphingomonas sp. CARO-RG-8B-R24-01]
MELEARVFTPHAGDYLAGLVSLWKHTYPARSDALRAEVNLWHLKLAMTADEQSLSLRLVGKAPGDICAARAVVERHLIRVRAQQAEAGLSIDWHEVALPSFARAAS